MKKLYIPFIRPGFCQLITKDSNPILTTLAKMIIKADTSKKPKPTLLNKSKIIQKKIKNIYA
jgi:hypothetical protein